MHQFMAFSILYVVSISLIGQKQLSVVGFRAKKEQKGQAALGQNGGKDKAFSRSKKVSTLKISDFWGRSINIYSLSYKIPDEQEKKKKRRRRSRSESRNHEKSLSRSRSRSRSKPRKSRWTNFLSFTIVPRKQMLIETHFCQILK